MRNLILIDQVHLLGELYIRVIIPGAVNSELQHEKTPVKVRDWIDDPPDWLEIQVVDLPDPTVDLGLGEREALALAAELHNALLLVDERKATKVARSRGILVTGTFGVLEEAARRGLVDLPAAIDRLPISVVRRSCMRPFWREIVKGGLLNNAAPGAGHCRSF